VASCGAFECLTKCVTVRTAATAYRAGSSGCSCPAFFHLGHPKRFPSRRAHRHEAEFTTLSSDFPLRFDQSSHAEISWPKSDQTFAAFVYLVTSAQLAGSTLDSCNRESDGGDSMKSTASASRSLRLRYRVAHRQIGLVAPRAMNQRVGPSLVYSVLIVCFFAVALFQPDAPRGVRGKPRSGHGDAVATTGLAPRPDSTDARRAALERTDRLERQMIQPAISSPARVKANAGRASSPSSLASAETEKATQNRAGRSPNPSPLSTQGPPSRRSSATSLAGTPGRVRAPASIRNTSLRTIAREPDGPFTVARVDETIEDIALRVYGTSDCAGSLWRANRDSLKSPDSRISPGMLLRTPSAR